MSTKALVTGATGYIGSKLCERLLAQGWAVDALVRNSGRPLPEHLIGSVCARPYDGNTQSLLDSVTTARPDVVFHLASLFIAEHRAEQIADLVNSNVLFGTQLAEACVRSGVKRFINTGTSWQHYRSEAYDPVCLYAATKQAFEDILDFYADAFDMSVITLKLFDTYGPDDPRPKLLSLLMKATTTGEALGLSPGEQLLDLVHIDDVTRAFTLCASHLLDGCATTPHERYALSSGEPISIRQIVTLIEQLSGKSINATFGTRMYREREVMRPWRAGICPPGWNAEIDLRSGLTFMLASADRIGA